jgi:hypothetical protein
MIWLLNVITFLSAFLLFQIELIIAKIFLPNYGGSYLVWGACVVFFQAALLLGYFFAQYFIDRWGMARYRTMHLALVLLPFLFFPGRELVVAYSGDQLPLVADVFLRLLTTVGPVFFVLSTMSVAWQVWLSRSDLPQRHNPYALYAVSNLGSFAALFSYPFFFEYLLDLTTQVNIWRAAYLVFAALNVAAFVLIKVKDEALKKDEAQGALVTRGEVLRWTLLGAGGVVMFLSVTNMITYEVTPVPLFWIIPLGIYLLAFVLNFKKHPWCPAWITKNIGLILGLSVSLFFIVGQGILPPVISIALLCVVLFLLCMYCQHELIVHQPRSHRSLAFFYVMISFGSFVGGFLTSWIIPLISINTVEFLVGLILIAAVRIFDKREKKVSPLTFVALAGWAAVLIVWPKIFPHYSIIGMALLVVALWAITRQLVQTRWALVAALVVIALGSSRVESIYKRHEYVHKERNYYGIYEIYDGTQLRTFIHGTTLHGVQLREGPLKPVPIGYYSPNSPVGEVMIENQETFKRVALIGLGAGSLAGYGNPKQAYDFYELDPDVHRMAKDYFTYIDGSASRNRFIFGDARLSLEKNADQVYDAIIVDAFGGDSIPVHLVTLDVIKKYRQHLAEDGIILFHATNRYLGMEPILARVGQALGAQVAIKDVPDGGLNLRSVWVAMTWDPQKFQHLIKDKGWGGFDAQRIAAYPLWTDQYSSILPIFKIDMLLGALKAFKLLAL